MELSVSNISVSFGELLALSDVSFSAQFGQVVALIGPNGAGKTTLLNVISGLITPDRGIVSIGGKDMTRQPPHKRAALGLGRTFQHARLMDDLPVIENVLTGGYTRLRASDLFGEWVALPPATQATSRQSREAQNLLETMELGEAANLESSKLSFGRKKLVDIARALMSKPRLVLMDEPTAGLSEGEIRRLVDVVQKMRSGAAIVLVAHHMGFVSEVADNVICLVAGQVIAQGTPREVQTDKKVLAAYMGSE